MSKLHKEVYKACPCGKHGAIIPEDQELSCTTGGSYPEFVPQYIKEDRKKYFNSLVQPFREGVPSREFAEAHPKEAKKIFAGETKPPQYVWRELPNWDNREKTQ